MRNILLLFFGFSALFAQMAPPKMPDQGRIAFQNSILCKVNENTISMMDVKKKLDLLFHQSYPNLEDSAQARFQFYETSWRHVLSEMINEELMVSDATDKEIKLTDGEIREEMESRFGPSVMTTLDRIGLTYDEAWKMVRKDLIVRRMSWWFIHAKALQNVTPKDIRESYQNYIKQNPSYKELKYKVLTLRSDDLETTGNEIYELLFALKKSPEEALPDLQALDPSIQISAEYIAKDIELSEVHRATLGALTPGTYSPPVIQLRRGEKAPIARLFYLSEAKEFPSPSFEEMSTHLQNELNQKAAAKESVVYMDKLRKHYGFDGKQLEKALPQDLHPFSME